MKAEGSQPGGPFADAAETWNRRFSGEGFLFGREPNEWLRGQAALLPSAGRVLCVADGEGRNGVWLARRGLRVASFDVSAVAVAKSIAFAREERVDLDAQVADCDGYEWPVGTCDAVVAIFVQFADPAQRERLFERMVAALAPGGVLVLQGYTPKQLEYRTGGPPFASHLYTEAMLREAFAGLEILALREYEAEVREGTGHNGRSALIGLVARR